MKKVKLAKIDPASTGKFRHKKEAKEKMAAQEKELYELLYLMFADRKYSLLVIFQGTDASGKDGVVRHIFQEANPQGIAVHSFKEPNEEELRHDFLWRCHKYTPESGLATIFNRSYYEEVSTVKVHPELLLAQNIPSEILKKKDFFQNRFEAINNFEKMLTQKGTIVLKFFLHISKKEQKERFKKRLDNNERNWKFQASDAKERVYWKQYQKVFAEMIEATNTKHAPWYIVPADHKWYRDYLVSQILIDELKKFKMHFPKKKQENIKLR